MSEVSMEVKAEKVKQLFEGKVVSDKMDKTIVVETEQTYIHPKFRKILRKTKSYKVHDEKMKLKLVTLYDFTNAVLWQKQSTCILLKS